MEVHHHPHTSRTKWTHYLWEFLMLFLAVYLGFLVENLREHRVEHNRADSYIASFYEDLKTDTTKLGHIIRLETIKVQHLSVFRSCYDSLLQNKNPASFFVIAKNTVFNNGFGPEQRTIVQLANAGGYRMLKKEDADSITSYVQRCNVIENYERTVYQESQDNLRNLFNQLIDFHANASLNKNLLDQPLPDVDSLSLPIIGSASKPLLNEYFNTLLQYIRVIVNHRNAMQRVNEKAGALIEYFKRKYNFN
jgi:hypothetical protein